MEKRPFVPPVVSKGVKPEKRLPVPEVIPDSNDPSNTEALMAWNDGSFVAMMCHDTAIK